MQRRNSPRADPGGPQADTGSESRPLTARSVVASTLLGVDPPQLPARLLVRSGELFGISEGTTRVALSRMVGAGELVSDGGDYRLAGRLLQRQARQTASRLAEHRTWGGDWELAVVTPERRDASARAALREAMRQRKLAELREGVWLRPDNLAADRSSGSQAIVLAQCRRFTTRLVDDDPADLVAALWDLDAWSAQARDFRTELHALVGVLEAGDTDPLAPGFVLSAAVLRHMLADPLLPDELLPDDWPGAALRDDYDRYDRAFKTVWRNWFRTQA